MALQQPTQRPRRPKGSGSIHQRADGRWAGTAELGRSAHGSRSRKTVYGETSSEVERKLRRLNDDLSAGLRPPDEKTPLGAYLDGWLESRHPDLPGGLRVKSWISYELQIREHIRPGLGNVAIGKLTSAKIANWERLMADAGVGGRTVQLSHAVLRSALTYARRDGIIPRNPAAGDRKQKGHRRKVPTPWTIDQARTFFAYVEDSPYRPIFLLAAYAGPREGEILGLGVDDLDLERGRAVLDSTLIRIPGSAWVDETKSEAGRRTVSLAPVVVSALREHLVAREAMAERAGDDWQESGLVFTRRDGSPMRNDSLLKTFQRMSRRAGLPVIRFHDLRRLNAAVMFSATKDAHQVRIALGQTSIQLASATYGYSLGEVGDEAAAAVETLLGGDRLSDRLSDDAVESSGV